MSCSYRPGRYDPTYEEKGQDYPLGYVRWTEQRNFEAVLDMMATGSLDVKPLISHRFNIHNAQQAYSLLSSREPHLAIVLEYDGPVGDELLNKTVRFAGPPQTGVVGERKKGEPIVGFIGAGNYAGRVLIPAFKEAGPELHTVSGRGGINSVHLGKKYGFEAATTEAVELVKGNDVNTIVIATRHDSHARFACASPQRGETRFC